MRKRKILKKTKRRETLPYWVIPETKVILKGLLHTCRRFEALKDVIVLISEEKPQITRVASRLSF